MGGEQVGSIYYDLDLDDKAFMEKLAGAKSAASGFSQTISDYFSASVSASKKFATGLGLVGAAFGVLGGFGLKAAGDIEAWRQGFVTLLGSTKAADEAIKQIQKDAATTPFTLPGLVQANLLLTGVTKNAGQSEQLLLNVGKALAAMGKGQPELDRIIVNLQQIGAVGHASMIDIKQFAFAGIPIFDMLTQATGKTGQALQDMISSGGVTFQMLEDMFNKAGSAGGRFADAFINQAGTFNQLWSNVGDITKITLANIVRGTGLFDAAKKAMSGFIDVLTSHQQDIQNGIIGALKWIQEHGQVVIAIIGGGLLPLVIAIVGAFAKFLVTLAPWVLLVYALEILVPKIVQHFGGWHAIMQKLQPYIEAVTGFIGNMGNYLKDLVGYLKDAWTWFNNLNPAVQLLISPLGFLIASFDLVKQIAKDIANIFMQYFWPSLQALWQAIATQLWPALQNLWQTLVNLWNFVSPVLLPVLQILGTILGVVIVAAVWLLINVIRIVVDVLSFLINVFSFLLNIAMTVIGAIVNLFMGLWNFLFPLIHAIADLFGAVFGLIWAIVKPIVDLIMAIFRADFAVIRDIVYALIGIFGAVFGAIWAIVSPVIHAIGSAFSAVVTTVRNVVDDIINLIRHLVDGIKSIAGSITSALTSPFTSAFNAIKSGADSVKGFLSNLNPFSRHSPSLVDWVKRGTAVITDEYRDMFNQIGAMSQASRPLLVGGVGGGEQASGTNVKTQIFGDINVGSQQDADYLLQRISYNDKLTSLGLTGG